MRTIHKVIVTAVLVGAASLSYVSSLPPCHSANGLPDPKCTPGVIDNRVNQSNLQRTICKSGYTATVRPPVFYTDRIKLERMAAYGLKGNPKDYELDHLIALEAGGNSTDIKNLWPEPYTGDMNAYHKDTVENRLHKEVCNGTMPLADAQKTLATNWERQL